MLKRYYLDSSGNWRGEAWDEGKGSEELFSDWERVRGELEQCSVEVA